MLWTQLARLALLIDVAVTLTSTDNEVYSGCGFEPVQGQAHMFKFCNAYGQCIKSSCGVDRVFSKSDCGCIPSVKNSILEWASGPSFNLHNVFTNKNTEHRTTSLTDSFSSILKATDRLVNVVVVEKDRLPPQRAAKTERAYSSPSNFTESSPSVLTNVNNSKRVLVPVRPSGIPGYSTSENFNVPISVRPDPQKPAVQNSSYVHFVEPKRNISEAIREDKPVSQAREPPHVASLENVQPDSSIINGPLINYSFDVSGILRSAPSESSTATMTTTPHRRTESTSAAATTRAASTSDNNTTAPTRNSTGVYEDLIGSMVVTGAPNGTAPVMDTGQLMCGAEVNITGMSDRNLLTGDAALGTVYIGIRGVTGSGGRIQFDGNGFLWIPLYESVRFTSGLTVSLKIKEDVAIQVGQGIVSNCGNDVTPSFSIALDPKLRLVKFKVVVVTTDTPVPIQETLQVSVPYEPGATKTIEMQCNGHKLIGRVGNHVTGTHIPSTETYRLSSRPKPIYIGKGCMDEQADNFYGSITNVAIYRCVRSDIALS